jgi:hypothetical protein
MLTIFVPVWSARLMRLLSNTSSLIMSAMAAMTVVTS